MLRYGGIWINSKGIEKKKEKKKRKKEKHNKALSFILWKKKTFFKKREKIRPQKQLKDYNVTEKELWIINDVYI